MPWPMHNGVRKLGSFYRMSESGSATRKLIEDFKVEWRKGDPILKTKFRYWATGSIVMFIAVIIEFGWLGLLFYFGLLMWNIGNADVKK